jgi:hypothetical protein
MLDLPDPVSDLLGVFFKRALDSQIAKRATLLLEMSIAGAIAFLLACGAALVAQQHVAWAVGAGMVSAGVALLATFQASPNSKGLCIALRQQIAQAETETNVVTIKRS